MNFSCLRIRRNGRIPLGVNQILHYGLCPALAHAADFYCLRADNLAGQFFQVGHYTFLKHGLQFVWRPRKQNQTAFRRLHYDTGSRSIMILHHNGIFRKHRLFPIVIRRNRSSLGKILFNRLFAGFMQLQILPANLCGNLFGQIILRWPQSSGKNDNIRPLHPRFQHLCQTLLIIPHHCLKITGQSQPCALFRQKSRIGVHNTSKQNFRSNTNKLNCHTYTSISHLTSLAAKYLTSVPASHLYFS